MSVRPSTPIGDYALLGDLHTAALADHGGSLRLAVPAAP